MMSVNAHDQHFFCRNLKWQHLRMCMGSEWAHKPRWWIVTVDLSTFAQQRHLCWVVWNCSWCLWRHFVCHKWYHSNVVTANGKRYAHMNTDADRVAPRTTTTLPAGCDLSACSCLWVNAIYSIDLLMLLPRLHDSKTMFYHAFVLVMTRSWPEADIFSSKSCLRQVLARK